MFTVQWFRAKSVLKARYTIWDEIPCKAGATKYATDEGLSPPLKKMECLSTSFSGAMKGYGWQQVIFLLISSKWRESLMDSITELIQVFFPMFDCLFCIRYESVCAWGGSYPSTTPWCSGKERKRGWPKECWTDSYPHGRIRWNGEAWIWRWVNFLDSGIIKLQ